MAVIPIVATVSIEEQPLSCLSRPVGQRLIDTPGALQGAAELFLRGGEVGHELGVVAGLAVGGLAGRRP